MTNQDIEAKREAIRQIKLQQSESAVSGETTTDQLKQISNEQNGSALKPEEPKLKNDNNNNIEEDQKYEFLAFARVFSGTLRRGQTLFVLSPRHNPEDFVGKVFNTKKPIC
jgi:ribosome assembly protein 1